MPAHICISKGPGALLGGRPWLTVLPWQTTAVKGSLPVLYLAKELSQGLGCSAVGFVLTGEGCNMVHFWGERNYISYEEANKISRQSLGIEGRE